MIKCLAIALVLTMTAASGLRDVSHRFGARLIQAGLADSTPASPAPAATPSPAPPSDTSTPNDKVQNDKVSCDKVTFTRGVKYGGDSLNVLDAATSQTNPKARRPIVIFVAGDSFKDDGAATALRPLVEQAMCFAANNGLVAFNVSYRVAPAATWPAGAKDVAAAISWIYENADLFGGNAQEIIPIGYGAGAFHVASLLAHKELQEKDDVVAGAVLVSGIYRPTAELGEGERAYFGTDASTYDKRSAVPGLLQTDEPIVLAWSSADTPDFIAQGEKLKDLLCNAGHCPRVAVLKQHSTPASVFDLDGGSPDLHERLRQLISQLDARGLP
jgi:acetyl esterase/lipase